MFVSGQLFDMSNTKILICAQKPQELQTRSANYDKDTPGRFLLLLARSPSITCLDVVEGGRRRGGQTPRLAARSLQPTRREKGGGGERDGKCCRGVPSNLIVNQ